MATTDRKAYRKAYYLKNRDKARAAAAQWKLENPEQARLNLLKWNLKYRFGLTIEQLNQMIVEQDNKCKTCTMVSSDSNKRLCIDHCHKTGKIRALLCGKCNKVLGLVNENITVLKNMINYIEEHAE